MKGCGLKLLYSGNAIRGAAQERMADRSRAFRGTD